MNKVERAVIVAAGKGERMKPLTLHTPKPLISIYGKRFIDHVIQALHKNGVYEIYVVVGYLKEKFKDLPLQYEGVKLIENPYYETCNNISSLFVARDHLCNAFITDADQMIYNTDILNPYYEKSGYNAVYTDGITNEWLMQVKNGRVVSCNRNGGCGGWQLYSISRWSAEDGAKLKQHLEEEFLQKKNTQIYWDDVVMFEHFAEYNLGVYPMQYSDIVEVDNFAELCSIDAGYEVEYEK